MRIAARWMQRWQRLSQRQGIGCWRKEEVHSNVRRAWCMARHARASSESRSLALGHSGAREVEQRLRLQ